MTTSLPALTLITTGGTIAGAAADSRQTRQYQAGVFNAEHLLHSLPPLETLADIRVVSPYSIDSKDITPAHWLTLHQCVQQALNTAETDGVVITHGTDTLEETAILLHLTLPAVKPVVITGAMRPPTALSADGPANLYQALQVAADPRSARRGVIVCFNGTLFSADNIIKHNSHTLSAFTAHNAVAMGTSDPVHFYGEATIQEKPLYPLPAKAEDFAEVPCIYAAAGSSPSLLLAAAAAGAAGIVLILPGNGSLPLSWISAVRQVCDQGIPVIRCSRCAQGEVSDREFDAQAGCVSARTLSPAAARIHLMLRLSQQKNST